MKTIIAQVIEETEKRINAELKRIDKEIEEFSNPIKVSSIPLDFDERRKWFDERMTGRLSTTALKKNYEEKASLEYQLKQILRFKNFHKEIFKDV